MLFGTFQMKLYGPLGYFLNYFGHIRNMFVDMENVFDLLSIKSEVADVADAQDLQIVR